jgi:hypothetical protein
MTVNRCRHWQRYALVEGARLKEGPRWLVGAVLALEVVYQILDWLREDCGGELDESRPERCGPNTWGPVPSLAVRARRNGRA